MSRVRDSKVQGKAFAVYANVSFNSLMQKVRNEQLYVIGPDGELVLDECGGLIGLYSRRLTHRMLKLFVKAHVESQLELALNLRIEIPLENIVLMDYEEISRMMDRITDEIYRPLKELR